MKGNLHWPFLIRREPGMSKRVSTEDREQDYAQGFVVHPKDIEFSAQPNS